MNSISSGGSGVAPQSLFSKILSMAEYPNRFSGELRYPVLGNLKLAIDLTINTFR